MIGTLKQADGFLLRVPEQRPTMAKVNGVWVHLGAAQPAVDWDRALDDVREEGLQTLRSV